MRVVGMPDIKKKKHVIYDLSVILSLQIYICSTFVCALFVGEESEGEGENERE